MLPQRLNGPIIKLDLLNPSHLEHVKSLICNPACVYVHFAPPCGTASRARLIQNQQHTLPPPLRDDQHPNGLPWLTLEQQIRVDKANQLYQITCNLIQLCEQHHILWSCENPGRSFMWQTTSFVKLFASLQCLSTEFHHCMFGSSRRKLTRLIHNVPSFHHLCDNQHEHEPWGQRPDGSWATSEERAYPWPLARAIAAQVYFKNLKYNAIHLASRNRKQHFKQCELPLISNLPNTCLLSCQNLSKYRPKPTTHRYHLILGNLALLSGGKSRVQPEIMSQ